jgi:hypothetical protein
MPINVPIPIPNINVSINSPFSMNCLVKYNMQFIHPFRYIFQGLKIVIKILNAANEANTRVEDFAKRPDQLQYPISLPLSCAVFV